VVISREMARDLILLLGKLFDAAENDVIEPFEEFFKEVVGVG
jgi:hypothetical protein